MFKYPIFILLIMVLVACKNEDDSIADFSDEIEILLINDDVESDGVSYARVTINVPDDLERSFLEKPKMIVFKEEIIEMESEFFLTNDDLYEANFYITNTYPETLNAEILITVSGYRIRKNLAINFIESLPESIEVQLSSLTLPSNSLTQGIEITTKAIRQTGKVNENVVINSYVLDSLGNEVGVFQNYDDTTDEDGIIKNQFFMGNTDYVGEMTVVTKTFDPEGDIIEKQNIIYSQ